jgi:hypothetical protein
VPTVRTPTALILLLAAACMTASSGCGGDDEDTGPATTSGSERPQNAGGTGGEGTGQGGNPRQGGNPGQGGAGGQEGDGGKVGDAQAAIERSLATVVGGGDPELVCEELATAHFVRSAYGTIEGCHDAVAAQRAVDVRVVDIAIDGPTATAAVLPLEGPTEGERQKAQLVHQEGVWKVDALRSNAPVGP